MSSPAVRIIRGIVAGIFRKHCRNCNQAISSASAHSIRGYGHFCDQACLEDWLDASVW